jgi:hypothetical protein
MLKRILLTLTFLIPALCHAQGGPGLSNFPGLQLVVNAPSGSCTAGSPAQLVMSSGTIYTCQSGTWAGLSGSGTISGVTAGTGLSGGGTSGTVTLNFSNATNAQIPNGINNNAVAAQSQLTVAATPYYLANSNLASPATLINGYQVGTTWRWRFGMTKNANGTGAMSFIIFVGTTGTTSDTAEVTQQWLAAGTAAVGSAIADVTCTITGINSGTATVYWSIAPISPGGAAGFISAAGVSMYNGTFTFSTATASLVFGLGVEFAAGGTMPTIIVPTMEANVYNLN